MKKKVYYSQCTELAYNINKFFYKDVHYVWCCDMPSYGLEQPASSNPLLRCKQLLSDILTNDQHSAMIENNREKIKLGAEDKFIKGSITEEQRNDIVAWANAAKIEEFFPLLYVIPYDKVKKIIVPVSSADKANTSSSEFKITELPGECFDTISFKNVIPLEILKK